MPTVIMTTGTSVLERLSRYWTTFAPEYEARNGEALKDPQRANGQVHRLAKGDPGAEKGVLRWLTKDDLGRAYLDSFKASESWRLAAEPATLEDLGINRAETRLHLVHGGNTASSFAAELLKEAFESDGLLSVEAWKVQHLGASRDQQPDEGIEELSTVLAELIQQAEELHGRAPTVCVTGGFKIASAFAAVMAQVGGAQVVYRYEHDDARNGTNIVVDPLPISLSGVGLRARDRRTAREHRDVSTRRGRLQEVLEGMHQQRLDEKAELEFIPDHHLPEAAQLAKRNMSNRVNHWVHELELWLGDPLPQMVGHDIAHSRNVDTRAVRLLLHSAHLRPHQAYTPTMYEALSSAAWLHDIGHVGGRLDSYFLRDWMHVREAHGMLSGNLIAERRADFFPGVPQDALLPEMVSQLCAHHQRLRRLFEDEKDPKRLARMEELDPVTMPFDEEPALKWFESNCDKCLAIMVRAYGSLELDLKDRLGGQPEAQQLWLQIAAILRVADACDNGQHRVAGRHRGGQAGWVQIWRREFADDLATWLEHNRWLKLEDLTGDPMKQQPDWSAKWEKKREEVVSQLSEYMRNPQATADGVVTALRRLAGDLFHGLDDSAQRRLKGLDASIDTEARRFEKSLKWLEEQSEHRRKHESVRSTQVVPTERGFAVDIHLVGHGIDEDILDAGWRTADYVYKEYWQVSPLMEQAGLTLEEVRIFRSGRGGKPEILSADGLKKRLQPKHDYASTATGDCGGPT